MSAAASRASHTPRRTSIPRRRAEHTVPSACKTRAAGGDFEWAFAPTE